MQMEKSGNIIWEKAAWYWKVTILAALKSFKAQSDNGTKLFT